ncbi:hypothetical protein [Herpetosiphon llansteffanensis]|uniref:hypothetical protein n=1 Tax=Herpetosiphon llansteffanensis TaxID=2094568 RepID=UPI000D7C6059|nr:hypothetical protein [Herpetosiphon llansteffanensis]
MDYREDRISALGVRSLTWHNNRLIDWLDGMSYQLDGTSERFHAGYDKEYDSAIQSPSGNLAVIYQRLGTQAMLIDRHKPVRKLTRDPYHAEIYEYPVVFLQVSKEPELLIHCPTRYLKLEVEAARTGRTRLAPGTSFIKRLRLWFSESDGRNPEDMFHSRLAISPGGTWLLSAGWIWHPYETVVLYPIAEALANPALLDTSTFDFGYPRVADISAAAFVNDQVLMLISGEYPEDDGEVPEYHDDPLFHSGPYSIGIYDLVNRHYRSVVKAEETVGTIMPLTERYLLGFYEHPKLFDGTIGKIIQRWPELNTGTQTSSLLMKPELIPPPIAFDQANQRFAVADEKGITVIELDSHDAA